MIKAALSICQFIFYLFLEFPKELLRKLKGCNETSYGKARKIQTSSHKLEDSVTTKKMW